MPEEEYGCWIAFILLPFVSSYCNHIVAVTFWHTVSGVTRLIFYAEFEISLDGSLLLIGQLLWVYSVSLLKIFMLVIT